MMKSSRPTGISILAILDLIGGIFLAFVGIVVAAATSSGVLSSLGYSGYANLAGALEVVGGLFAVLGVIAILAGWGMWTGRAWAWTLAVVLYVLGALFSLISLLGGSLASVVGLLIEVFLLWYMFRPHVRAFFGRGMPAQPAPMAQPGPSPTL